MACWRCRSSASLWRNRVACLFFRSGAGEGMRGAAVSQRRARSIKHMWTCPRCGQENAVAADRCPYCGLRTAALPPEQRPGYRPPHRQLFFLGFGLGALWLLGFVGIALLGVPLYVTERPGPWGGLSGLAMLPYGFPFLIWVALVCIGIAYVTDPRRRFTG